MMKKVKFELWLGCYRYFS